ncbi:MAG: glycosyltransferase family 4 protein [Candidatus Dormibacteria bacterium]
MAPALAAFVVTLALVIPARRLSVLAGFIQLPDPRRIHAAPTALLGGLAMAAGYLVAVLLFGVRGGPSAAGAAVVPVAAAALMSLDDRAPLRPLLKLALQLALALGAIVAFGIHIDYLTLPRLGVVGLGVLSIPLTLGWLLGMQNTVNLMDGIDGLAAGVVAIVALALMLAAASHGQTTVVVLCAALAGACLGFLLFNFYPASIFMGDGGSHFLGLALGIISVMGIAKVEVVLALFIPLLALGLPIFDTAWAIVRRRRRGLSVAHADTQHLHYRLLRLGMSQRETCWFFYLATASFSAVGLMLFGHRKVLGVVAILAAVGLSTLVGSLLERSGELTPVSRPDPV